MNVTDPMKAAEWPLSAVVLWCAFRDPALVEDVFHPDPSGRHGIGRPSSVLLIRIMAAAGVYGEEGSAKINEAVSAVWDACAAGRLTMTAESLRGEGVREIPALEWRMLQPDEVENETLGFQPSDRLGMIKRVPHWRAPAARRANVLKLWPKASGRGSPNGIQSSSKCSPSDLQKAIQDDANVGRRWTQSSADHRDFRIAHPTLAGCTQQQYIAAVKEVHPARPGRPAKGRKLLAQNS